VLGLLIALQLVAVRGRLGRKAALCYLIGADVPARLIPDIVAGVGIAARRGSG